jgi:hypothetical protein
MGSPCGYKERPGAPRGTEIKKALNAAKEMILGDVVLKIINLAQVFLTIRLMSHYEKFLLCLLCAILPFAAVTPPGVSQHDRPLEYMKY